MSSTFFKSLSITLRSFTQKPYSLRQQLSLKNRCEISPLGSRQSMMTLAQHQWLAVKTISQNSRESSYKHSRAQGRMLTPAFTIAPLGKRMGSRTSQGILACQLQWMSVSSKSKMSVGLWARGNFLEVGCEGIGLLLFLMKWRISSEATKWFLQSWSKLVGLGFEQALMRALMQYRFPFTSLVFCVLKRLAYEVHCRRVFGGDWQVKVVTYSCSMLSPVQPFSWIVFLRIDGSLSLFYFPLATYMCSVFPPFSLSSFLVRTSLLFCFSLSDSFSFPFLLFSVLF